MISVYLSIWNQTTTVWTPKYGSGVPVEHQQESFLSFLYHSHFLLWRSQQRGRHHSPPSLRPTPSETKAFLLPEMPPPYLGEQQAFIKRAQGFHPDRSLHTLKVSRERVSMLHLGCVDAVDLGNGAAVPQTRFAAEPCQCWVNIQHIKCG